MEYFVVAVLTSAVVIFFGTEVICSINCIRVCGEKRNTIVCNKSLILISDITSLTLEKNYVAFENIKRDCMGKESCDPSRTCVLESTQSLLVHYQCVNKSHIVPTHCNSQGEPISTRFGFIQSYNYPAAMPTSMSCRWQINTPPDSAVVLTLLDIVISKENCDRVLRVIGTRCKRELHEGNFCRSQNITNLAICGRVDIELQPVVKQHPLRFWISFQVFQKDQIPSYSALQCADTDRNNKHTEKGIVASEVTAGPDVNNQDSNTDVLVIMLSIISGISAVLLVILIIVCVRCRLLQVSRAQPMYSDPSPSGQAHYEYISSTDTEKPQPRLVEGYCQVADAVPLTQRVETAISPAYVQLEQFVELKKVLASSSSEECLKGCKFLKKEDQTFSGMSLDNSWSKCGVLDRLKCDRSTQSDREIQNVSNRSSKESEALPSSAKKDVLYPTDTSAINMDDNCSSYEPIGKYSSNKLHSNSRPHVQEIHRQSERLPTNTLTIINPTSQICGKNLDLVKKSTKLHSETFNSAQPSYIFPDVISSVINSPKKTDCLNASNAFKLSEEDKSLLGRNSKAVMEVHENKSSDNKHAAHRDMPQASGIVKNGIRKFEEINP